MNTMSHCLFGEWQSMTTRRGSRRCWGEKGNNVTNGFCMPWITESVISSVRSAGPEWFNRGIRSTVWGWMAEIIQIKPCPPNSYIDISICIGTWENALNPKKEEVLCELLFGTEWVVHLQFEKTRESWESWTDNLPPLLLTSLCLQAECMPSYCLAYWTHPLSFLCR